MNRILLLCLCPAWRRPDRLEFNINHRDDSIITKENIQRLRGPRCHRVLLFDDHFNYDEWMPSPWDEGIQLFTHWRTNKIQYRWSLDRFRMEKSEDDECRSILKEIEQCFHFIWDQAILDSSQLQHHTPSLQHLHLMRYFFTRSMFKRNRKGFEIFGFHVSKVSIILQFNIESSHEETRCINTLWSLFLFIPILSHRPLPFYLKEILIYEQAYAVWEQSLLFRLHIRDEMSCCPLHLFSAEILISTYNWWMI